MRGAVGVDGKGGAEVKKDTVKGRPLVEVEDGVIQMNPGIHGPMPLESWEAKLHTDRMMVFLGFEVASIEDTGPRHLRVEHTCNVCGHTESRPVEPPSIKQFDKVFEGMTESGWILAPSFGAPSLYLLLCPDCLKDYRKMAKRALTNAEASK